MSGEIKETMSLKEEVTIKVIRYNSTARKAKRFLGLEKEKEKESPPETS